MTNKRMKALGNFKKMVANNLALIARANGGELVQVCKCINPHQLEHLSWMLSQSVDFFEKGWEGKANRWLGYIQGVLSTSYGVGLEDLKSANRDLEDVTPVDASLFPVSEMQKVPLDEAFEKRPGMTTLMMVEMLVKHLATIESPEGRAAALILKRSELQLAHGAIYPEDRP